MSILSARAREEDIPIINAIFVFGGNFLYWLFASQALTELLYAGVCRQKPRQLWAKVVILTILASIWPLTVLGWSLVRRYLIVEPASPPAWRNHLRDTPLLPLSMPPPRDTTNRLSGYGYHGYHPAIDAGRFADYVTLQPPPRAYGAYRRQ